MKLDKILESLNSLEKNAFLKIIDGIIQSKPTNAKMIDTILMDKSKELKGVDNQNIAKIFSLVEKEYIEFIKGQFVNIEAQLDILIDIISKDGNCIMKQDWFARLYEKELALLNKKIKNFQQEIKAEKSEYEQNRLRDYKIYEACFKTAFYNDDLNNLDRKVTPDEHFILQTLSGKLGLSREEMKLINYSILPIKRREIDEVINSLKQNGLIFYSKRQNTIYVADEVVRALRKVRGKEVADKFLRRILLLLNNTQLNLLCKKYNIDRSLPLNQKIKEIINAGVLLSSILMEDIYKTNTLLTDKKNFINEVWAKGLKINLPLKGILLEDKIANLIKHFEDIERDEKVGISLDGYEKLLIDLGEHIKELNGKLKDEFELQEDNVLNSKYLLDYNIKPRDVIELVSEQDLNSFCVKMNIKTRGDRIFNILEAYKDSENLYLENYINIGYRNLAALKGNGIIIKEADLGKIFEELTKKIFFELGFNVDESLRKKINTAKDKVDILINLGNNDLILIECKTIKETGFNKFAAVSRQLKSYAKLIKLNDFKLLKSLLVAPEFSDEFIKDCGLEYELNLSLVTAESLIKILDGFKKSKHKQFPHNLLMRDVLIQEDRILKAIGK